MAHRLKTMRKAFKKTQKEIADFLGIGQNTYSYWERGAVRIDTTSFVKLSKYYNVSMDFLTGMSYSIKNPIQNWPEKTQNEYHTADEYTKQYMEYLYGELYFSESKPSQHSEPIIPTDSLLLNRSGETTLLHLTPDEIDLVQAFIKAFKSTRDKNDD